MLVILTKNDKWDKVFKSGLSKFFKGCLSQNILSPLLNTLSQISQQYIIFTFLKSNTFVKELFTGNRLLSPTIKNENKVHIRERKKYCQVQFSKK